jgi:prephenate dehydrogenase
MKRMTAVLLAGLFMSSAAISAAQTPTMEKDECLLSSRNCVDQVDDIQKRIHKLNREIKKGTRTYSPQELKKLQMKLDETRQLLKTIEENSGS